MSARNNRSEFVANCQLSEINRFNCLNGQFWAVPKSLNVSRKSDVSHVSDVLRGTIKFSSRSWRQRLQFIVYCSQVVDKFWR